MASASRSASRRSRVDGTEAADAQAGAGEQLALNHVLGQAEFAADNADLVLVQQLDGLAELKLQILGQAAHVMVSLYPILGLQNVGIDGSLGEEADLVASLAGLLLKFRFPSLQCCFLQGRQYFFIPRSARPR